MVVYSAKMVKHLGGWSMLALASLLSSLVYVWFEKIEAIVPEPYLDEVLHVRQAKLYLQGRWDIWDPKITTPPGLYLLSYLQGTFLPTFDRFFVVDTSKFRIVNLIAASLGLVWEVRRVLLLIIHVNDGQSGAPPKKLRLRWSLNELNHAAFNICLFPPLFFFYGLYYTDVVSALLVLITYRFHLQQANKSLVLAGFASLLFRQTNIFWVAIFLGGIEINRSLARGRPGIEFSENPTLLDVIAGSLQNACTYDPLLSKAYAEDYIKTCFSIGLAAIANLQNVLTSLFPYLLVLCGFGTFVKLNGGVVLGDKENHVASIHLVKMLYVWPYFMFFSFPLLYPYLINRLVPRGMLPSISRIDARIPKLPRISLQLASITTMLLVVHYNTTVHPFTLADNRHYMFYVFRHLLRHPLIKYAAVPVYFYCAWATISAFGGTSYIQDNTRPQISDSVRMEHKLRYNLPPPPEADAPGGLRISFVLVWLLATTLSLVTAPLVEPRYFIVPWIIWRLHVHTTYQNNSIYQARKESNVKRKGPWSTPNQAIETLLYVNQSRSLWFETAWFLVINWATAYIFLYWGFEWSQEPGKVQRFMW